MKTKSFFAILLALCLGASAWASVRTDALDLRLDEEATSASPAQIALQWTQPRLADPNEFASYQILRAGQSTTTALSWAGLASLAASLLLTGYGLRMRRRGLSSIGLALGVMLPLAFSASAGFFFKVIHVEPSYSKTSYIDTSVEAGVGYYYKVNALYKTQAMQVSETIYAVALDRVDVPDQALVVRFDPGSGAPYTPEDGIILPDATTSATFHGCVATTADQCGSAGRAASGTLLANEVSPTSLGSGSFTHSVGLLEGPNFVRLTGTNGTGKSITLARTTSVGGSALTGTQIPNALGVSISNSVGEKLTASINSLTPADWNELLGQIPPGEIHIANDVTTLDLAVTGLDMDNDGDVIVDQLSLIDSSPTSLKFAFNMLFDGININYTQFDATFAFSILIGQTCGSGPGRIRFGQMRTQGIFEVSKGLDPNNPSDPNEYFFFSYQPISPNADFLVDEAALTSDAFDTGRTIAVLPFFCGLGDADIDANLIAAVNNQAEDVFANVKLGSTSIHDVAMGQSGLLLDLSIAELSQDPSTGGVVIQFDAGINNAGPAQVEFLRTDNPPPDSRTAGGYFPSGYPSDWDASFTLSDDLLNEAYASSLAAGRLTTSIENELKLDGTTVPLTVQGLDPGPNYSASAYLPNLHLHAPAESKIRVAINYSINPVIGMRRDSVGGYRLLQTGLTATILVDADRNGLFDDTNEAALTMDLDVLAQTTASLDSQTGGVKFDVQTVAKGYTVSPGFMTVSQESVQALANAILEDRVQRLLEVLNGVAGNGLVIEGFSFTTVDSASDGTTAATYKDAFTVWGAADIDFKVLFAALIKQLNTPPDPTPVPRPPSSR